MPIVAGSILGGNLLNIEEIIKLSEESEIDWLHLDIMDGNFVPNLTFGYDFVKKIKEKTKLPVDVHLMVINPEKYIHYSEYCDMITFHIETTNFPMRLIENIKKIRDIKVGVALNPITNVEIISNLEGYIDNVLIMTVEPGFAGQKFISNCLNKIYKAKQLTKKWKKDMFISVDGGIDDKNYKLVLEKGANYIVCASFLYQDYSKTKQRVKLIKKGENYA
ncbi:MAG: ribulose-phosphate 3-epimerase [bacterium]